MRWMASSEMQGPAKHNGQSAERSNPLKENWLVCTCDEGYWGAYSLGNHCQEWTAVFVVRHQVGVLEWLDWNRSFIPAYSWLVARYSSRWTVHHGHTLCLMKNMDTAGCKAMAHSYLNMDERSGLCSGQQLEDNLHEAGLGRLDHAQTLPRTYGLHDSHLH